MLCKSKKKQKTKSKKTQKLWLSCVVFKFLSKKIINLEDRNWKQTGAQHSIWSSKSRAFHIFPHRQVFYYSYTSKTILNKMSPNYGYFGFHIDFHWSLCERKQKSSNVHPPPPFCRGHEPPTKFPKRGAWQDLNF